MIPNLPLAAATTNLPGAGAAFSAKAPLESEYPHRLFGYLMPSTRLKNLWPALRGTLKRGFQAWIFVTKLTIPAMLLTRLLLYFELIPYVAAVFEPAMALMGLPPEAALIWVAGMVANLYVAITVFVSLAPVMGTLTLAQVTTLGCLCLLAHGLIVEGQVCRGAGLSFWRVTIFRILAALVFGLIVCHGSASAGWGGEPSVMLIEALDLVSDPVPSWSAWLLASARQLIMILVVVEILMLGMELIKFLRLTRLIMKALGPVLRLAGVGEKAVMVTVIGCVVGLALGGGLIIAESRGGHISQRDIFGSMMLMAVFHSMIEDTLIVWAFGGSLWWLLGARLIFAVALAGLVTRLAQRPAWKPILVGSRLDFSK